MLRTEADPQGSSMTPPTTAAKENLSTSAPRPRSSKSIPGLPPATFTKDSISTARSTLAPLSQGSINPATNTNINTNTTSALTKKNLQSLGTARPLHLGGAATKECGLSVKGSDNGGACPTSEDLETAQARHLYERVRSCSPQEGAKLLHRTLADLARFEVLDGAVVKRRGLISVGNRISVEEYKRRVTALLRVLANLPPPLASAISQNLGKIPDSTKLAQKLKDFFKEVELRTSQPSVIPEEALSVYLFDCEAKFQKLLAVFGAGDIEEAYSNDTFSKTCSEIDRLLKGEETMAQQRSLAMMEDEAQRDKLLQLSEMLHALIGKSGKPESDSDPAVLTIRSESSFE